MAHPSTHCVEPSSLHPIDAPIDLCRRFFAEEIRVVAGLDRTPSGRELTRSFACVPRERFLGSPPWLISSGASLRPGNGGLTCEVRDLYHDVFVALRHTQSLNNGQPSLIARLIAALDLEAGKSVLHVGCGTGYYTAIMAEMVGPSGAVLGLEIDAGLCAEAARNLYGYRQVNVEHVDGAHFPVSSCDAIFVNAGINTPLPGWLQALKPGGVLLTPLLLGRTSECCDAMAFRFIRPVNPHAEPHPELSFSAEPLLLLTIYPSPSLRDASTQTLLNSALESHRILDIRSLLCRPHPLTSSCVVHAETFCLSSLPFPAIESRAAGAPASLECTW